MLWDTVEKGHEKDMVLQQKVKSAKSSDKKTKTFHGLRIKDYIVPKFQQITFKKWLN